ncbi:MAG: 16S rRNA (guanine(527)-N(7))-methyltransferase RsmG [Rhodospirillales bacterium]
MTPEAFAAAAGVSRETLARLVAYVDLLRKWQARINLVATASLDDVWRRHVLDSAQLVALIQDADRVTDLGSGAGFPGLVVAIVRGGPVDLVESDARKCAFLREAARIAAAPVTVHNARAEAVVPWPADVVTARAVAPVAELLALSYPFVRLAEPRPGCALLLKGARADAELTEAARKWHMTVTRSGSVSDPSGCILRIDDIAPLGDRRQG